MYKLKDNANLKDLEKIGFYLEGNTYKYNLPLHKCAYICIIPEAKKVIFPCYNLRWYQFIFKNKIIKEINIVQNKLIKTNLIEEVDK